MGCNRRVMIMATTTAAPQDGSRRAHIHARLWSLPNGTGLHAPYGQLVISPALAGSAATCPGGDMPRWVATFGLRREIDAAASRSARLAPIGTGNLSSGHGPHHQ